MTSSRKHPSRGFTLIELLGALSVLFVAASAGTKLDLVDLVETQNYLEAKQVDTDSDALIRLIADVATDEDTPAPTPSRAEREQLFLLQVACRELGHRQEQEAVPAIRRLAEHPDYFVAKHAKEALVAIENGGASEAEVTLPDELKELLPKGAKVGLAFPGGLRENTQRVARALPSRVAPQMISMAVSAVGNVEIGRVVVVYDTDGTPSGTFVVILVEGHFYQDAVVEMLGPLRLEPQISEEDEWVGIFRDSRRGVDGPVRVALAESRGIAISLLSDSIDEATLLKIAKAFGGELQQ